MLGKIDIHEITRLHGMNALRTLAHAYQSWEKREYWREVSKNESWEHKWQTADESGSHVLGCTVAMQSGLFAAVILYQASMEAILSNAARQSTQVEAVTSSGSFGSKWTAALQDVGETTKEFNVYHDHFYKELRIPLTHLHPHTETRLEKINAIDFPDVYNGVRYGWWAHIRLLGAIGLGTGGIQDNWEFICEGASLPPDLFPESHPDQLPDA